jgi:pyruvate kinase
MTIKIERHRPPKRTKIVATLGPASMGEERLRQMILAGLDVVRLNFSHGQPETLAPVIELVRRLSDEMNVPLAILGDLRGPRIRVGEMENGSIELKTGQKVVLTPQPVIGTPARISVSFSQLAGDVEVGSLLLLDDGNLELKVEAIQDNGDVACRVGQGGTLSSHRGINLPGLRVSLPSITKKDYADIDFAIAQKLDFLALSFVQSANDVRQLKAYLAGEGAKIPVIAKIEKKGALDDIEAIVQEAYGVMVARGDLALEMSIQDVPIAQKRIIAACRRAAIPVITATQMLESMIERHKPTRAEATDVANAILDGTDALMLSGETAIGKYPAETVATMAVIAVRVERACLSGELPGWPEVDAPRGIDANVAYASQVVAESIAAKTIVIHTTTGATARRVTCHRPQIPVLALTSQPATRRRLALTWGVESDLVENIQDTDHMVKLAFEHVLRRGIAALGETIVITAGTPYGTAGRTNMLKVEQISSEINKDEAVDA